MKQNGKTAPAFPDAGAILEGIGAQIEETALGYIRAEGFSGTESETLASDYFTAFYEKLPYFQAHPDLLGRYDIPGDAARRSVRYAIVRGASAETVVLLHHSDVVSTEDYRGYARIATDPEALRKALLKEPEILSPEAREDLLAGEFIFAHGLCDMKGGGAIQMALTERFSRLSDFPGTVINVAVPDEENLSAGMRAAASLLDELQKKYGFSYRLLINCEPHERAKPDTGMFSTGSIGKLLPFVYVRGVMAHAGKVFEGLNPMGILARVAAKTETAFLLPLEEEDEACPAPTWLYLRDDKERYDVSMPKSAYGCLSVLTSSGTPQAVLGALADICREAFAECLANVEQNARALAARAGKKPLLHGWQPKVVSFGELKEMAASRFGRGFEEEYGRFLAALRERSQTEQLTMAETNRLLVAYLCDMLVEEPLAVYGLIPPFYPAMNNRKLFEADPLRYAKNANIETIDRMLADYAQATFGDKYESEKYFMGISDLSYAALPGSAQMTASFAGAMPLYPAFYDIPFEAIGRIGMPSINVGPCGKDYHKLSERVSRRDLYEVTPALVLEAIRLALE